MSNNAKQENQETSRRDRFRDKHVRLTKEVLMIDSLSLSLTLILMLVFQNARVENERFLLKKNVDIAAYDNEGLNNRIMIMTKKYNEELDQLKDVLLKKEEKLEKINKKIREKEIIIEEMERDKQNMLL